LPNQSVEIIKTNEINSKNYDMTDKNPIFQTDEQKIKELGRHRFVRISADRGKKVDKIIKGRGAAYLQKKIIVKKKIDLKGSLEKEYNQKKQKAEKNCSFLHILNYRLIIK
jgi:hypothetical protein